MLKKLLVQRSGNLQKYQSKNILVKMLLRKFLNNLNNMVNSIGIVNILELGCAEGFIINYLKLCNTNFIFEGVDISKEAIEIAKELNPGVNFKVNDINNLEYGENSFDLVMMIEVLEHLQYPQRVLWSIKNISKKYFIFSVPREPYFSVCNFIRGKNILRFGSDPEHLHKWRKSQFIKLIENYFYLVKIKYSFPWLIVICIRR